MAFRVRLLHLILVGVIGMSLVIFSSYFGQYTAVPLQTDGASGVATEAPSVPPVEVGQDNSTAVAPPGPLQQSNEGSSSPAPVLPVNVSQSTSSPSTPASPPHSRLVSMTVTSEHQVVDAKNIVFHVQQIPSKVVSSTTASTKSNHTQDSTEKAVTTRSIYQSGHEIPNLELCPDLGSHLQVMIIITSAPAHKDARMAIRQTWGHFRQRVDVSIAFLLGTVQDVKLQQVIRDEFAMYGDIINANFVDTYNNLTLKTISMLEWVDLYCNRAKFFLKTDDDMFINVPALLNFIAKHSQHQRSIFGRLAKKWKPIRASKSKYYVSPQQYRPAVFPNFTTGPAYLITGDSVHDLYSASLNKTYLKLEDVYVTGIVAQDVKVKRVHANEFFNKRIMFNPCNIQKGISIHMIKFHEQFDLWKKLMGGQLKCP